MTDTTMTKPETVFASGAGEEAPLIEITDLKKHFPVTKGVFSRVVGQVHAVDGVSFSIKPGETLGLVGESGLRQVHGRANRPEAAGAHRRLHQDQGRGHHGAQPEGDAALSGARC